MLIFHIITLFPESFSYLDSSMLARAKKKKKIAVKFYNPRDFTTKRHGKVDDKPYGGGPGMVMQAEPILKAVEKATGRKKKVKLIILSPDGKAFSGKEAIKLAKNYKNVILIAGHYEGIDERLAKALKVEKVSIGPYTLTGGELPAMVVVDAVAREIAGVLGSAESREHTRIASPEVYTRPEIITFKGKNYKVPKVLLEGNHKKIDEWRQERLKKKEKRK
ncbi:MAG: tRNA (guanosine(37)-N1)-methyltransferase TrmD [Candidatus Paceibacterota bacterium]